MVRALLAVLCSLTVTVVLAPAAMAHDQLVGNSPTDGERVSTPPTEVVLDFSGQLSELGAQVQVTGPDGDATDGTPVVSGERLSQPLDEALPAGDYTVVWRVTSSDGHPISGGFNFTLTSAASTTPADAIDDQTPRTTQPTGETAATPGTTDETATSEMPQTSPTSAAEVSPQADASPEAPDQGSALPVWGWLLGGAGVLALLGTILMGRRRG
ncbi:copper resistance protein CopC [Ornithinimicrobium panacihumi]|uniref:copper resistance CopC family protein n=1 Tax=Ornithinimicrobium panacihumi TaxID=2008449 RepID=UPI003F8862ED